MIRRADIVARLRGVTSLRQVQGVAELAALTQNPPAHLQPAAWVVPLAEQAAGNRLANAVSQANTVTFGVVLCLTDLRDARGEAAGDALELLRADIHDALIGWQPPGATGVVLFSGGGAVDLDPQKALWWLDRYQVVATLRRT